MKLNIKQIEVFAAVMEHGSTIAAANHLRVSQPSVSKHLKLLEASSGVNLFIRKNNRLIPTPEAIALHKEIERTYVGVAHLERFVTNLSSNVKFELGIGAMPMIAQRWLPKVVSKFLRKCDHFSVTVQVGTHQAIGEWVSSSRVDMGICMEVADDIGVEQERILRLPIVCALPETHAKVDLPAIGSSDLDAETLIILTTVDEWKSEKEQWRLAIPDKLDADKVRPRNMISVSTSYEACELVRRGTGIALVDALTAQHYNNRGVRWLPFNMDFTFDVYLILPKAGYESRLAPQFLDELRKEATRLNDEVRSLHPAFG